MTVKEKDKEKKRRNRKYGQARLKHAKKGVVSCWIGGGTFLLFLLLIFFAVVQKGMVGTFAGGIGLIAAIFAGIGIAMALRGLKEREKNYITCKVGLVMNIFLIWSFILIYARGFL